MRKKSRFTIMLFCLFGIGMLHAQNNLVVALTDGTQQSSLLSSLSKITFSGSNTVLNYSSGTSVTYATSSIHKLLFSTVSATSDVLGESQKITVYPNPATDYIHLKNVTTGATAIVIYRLDGAAILSTQLSSDTREINISTLAKGFYLLKVNNQTLKFMKL